MVYSLLGMKYTWYYETAKIDLKFIDNLVDNCLSKKLEDGVIGKETGVFVTDKKIRKAKITFLNKKEHLPVFDVMDSLGVNINNEAFGFDINQLEACQFTLYNANDKGKYDWHMDTDFISNNCYHRKMSVIIQLSNPSDYEGGKLELRNSGFSKQDEENIIQKGSVLAFPSFMEHRVTPVTKGKRMSLIGWFIGAKFR